MKRILLFSLVLALMAGALGLSGTQKKTEDFSIDLEGRNPWTHLRFNNGPETFHFAVVSDRTGGHRARVFSQAVDQLNLLQPAFVVTVGDLIEGYTKDTDKIAREWKEFQSYVHKLQMPFFYVPGNHDLSNAVQVQDWKERFGRSYYHFLYKGVLFLALATDDEGEDKEYAQISPEQVAYFQNVLKTNPDVRWTIVLLHKPVWAMPNFEKNRFQEIEKALVGRNYTVFAGHVHRYQKFIRQGMNYYQLATTGGGSKMRGLDYREFDHLTWVTMKNDGPTVANLLLDGILPEDLRKPITDEDGYVRLNRKAVFPVRGRASFDGAPIPGARVFFNVIDPKTKKVGPISDARVESDGTFQMSTYEAFDGVPVGEYFVTVVWQDPPKYDGTSSPNKLPAKYASALTSELRYQVQAGTNEVELKLVP